MFEITAPNTLENIHKIVCSGFVSSQLDKKLDYKHFSGSYEKFKTYVI